MRTSYVWIHRESAWGNSRWPYVLNISNNRVICDKSKSSQHAFVCNKTSHVLTHRFIMCTIIHDCGLRRNGSMRPAGFAFVWTCINGGLLTVCLSGGEISIQSPQSIALKTRIVLKCIKSLNTMNLKMSPRYLWSFK